MKSVTKRTQRDTETHTPRIYSRDEHEISRRNISDSALKVLYRLHKAGYGAYLVGGAVRDLLLGEHPKDFDIATDALPEEVCELFRNSRLIGRRFRIVHVRFGREIIEVATFRGHHEGDAEGASIAADGRILRDNVYGQLGDDVWRRDFTINALYYNIADFSVVDYVGGVEDLRHRRLRLIGDAKRRYVEDPIRLLRAVRFAAKLGAALDQQTEQAVAVSGELLSEVSSARLFDEVVKIFHCGKGVDAFQLMQQYGLAAALFPHLNKLTDPADRESANKILICALGSTDERVADGRSVTPAFVFAALLWAGYLTEKQKLAQSGALSDFECDQRAGDRVIEQQLERIAIPRKFTSYIREIWALQNKFGKRTPKRVERLLTHRKFRAAYDFLVLRRDAGEDVGELADWWTAYQSADEQARADMISQLGPNKPKRRRRRSPRSKRQEPEAS